MRIGELARLAGLRPHTIRFYEGAGLLPRPRRTPAGYRAYDSEALNDLRFIAKAQASGLRLSDVREVMQIAAGGRPPCDHVRATVAARLVEVERHLCDLRGLRSALRATLGRLDKLPRPTRRCRCAALESGPDRA
jgi:DNA-binding transcriptional MerR regulator